MDGQNLNLLGDSGDIDNNDSVESPATDAPSQIVAFLVKKKIKDQDSEPGSVFVRETSRHHAFMMPWATKTTETTTTTTTATTAYAFQ